MKRLLTTLGVVACLAGLPARSLAHDAYDDSQAHPLRIAAYSLPVTHGIQLLQDFLLRGGTNQAWELAALGGIGVVLFLLTSVTLRRNLHSAA